ncbi:hypothetical protein HDV05_005950 [Chytridiales sp. JEL 0842]|nr:hypothetical protein HDV05_005950 [Chytridiales sp. JEL 0842]
MASSSPGGPGSYQPPPPQKTSGSGISSWFKKSKKDKHANSNSNTPSPSPSPLPSNASDASSPPPRGSLSGPTSPNYQQTSPGQQHQHQPYPYTPSQQAMGGWSHPPPPSSSSHQQPGHPQQQPTSYNKPTHHTQQFGASKGSIPDYAASPRNQTHPNTPYTSDWSIASPHAGVLGISTTSPSVVSGGDSSSPYAPSLTSPRTRLYSTANFKSLVTQDPYFYERSLVPPYPPPQVLDGLFGSTETPIASVVGSAPVGFPRDTEFRKVASSLDVTRVTNRVLACGLPWDKATDKRAHRNNVNDLARFLETRFGRNYMIWNLAGDTSQGDYPTTPFSNQVLTFGLTKAYHMSLRTLFDICRSLHSWLSLSDSHVAVLHCTNGVGRTGVAAACYLRYTDLFDDTAQAFDYFVSRRTPDDASWVGVSQRRYVQYFNNVMLLQGGVPTAHPLKLCRISMNRSPNFDGQGGCRPGLEVYQTGKLVYSSVVREQHGFGDCFKETDGKIGFTLGNELVIEKDIQVRIFHSLAPAGEVGGQVVTMVNFSFHTGFMPPGLIRVRHQDLDLWKRDLEEGRFPGGFSLDLVLAEVGGGVVDEEKGISYVKYLDKSLGRCLARLVGCHMVKVDEASLRSLEACGVMKVLACLALQRTSNDLNRAKEYVYHLTQGPSLPADGIKNFVQPSFYDSLKPNVTPSVVSKSTVPSPLPNSYIELKSSANPLNKTTPLSVSTTKAPPTPAPTSSTSEPSPRPLQNPTTTTPLPPTRSSTASKNTESSTTSSVQDITASIKRMETLLARAASQHKTPTSTQSRNRQISDPPPASSVSAQAAGGVREPAPPKQRHMTTGAGEGKTTMVVGGGGGEEKEVVSLEDLLQQLRARRSARQQANEQMGLGGKYGGALAPSLNSSRSNSEGALSTGAAAKPVSGGVGSLGRKEDVGVTRGREMEVGKVPGSPRSLTMSPPRTVHSEPAPPPPPPPPPPHHQSSQASATQDLMSPESDRGARGQYTGPLTTMVDGNVIPIQSTGARRGSSSSTSSNKDAPLSPPDAEPDVKRFEELFCFVPGTTKGPHGSSAPRMVQKAQFTTILDLRRANNVAIGMARYTRRKLTSGDLMSAIQTLDESVLGSEDLVCIQMMLPTRDERKLLRYYAETVMSTSDNVELAASAAQIPKLPLAPAETYMLELMKDPKLEGRLGAFQFKLELNPEVEDLRLQIANMKKVCVALKTSDSLKDILKTVLQLGNLSNQEYGAGNSSYRPWMGKEARALGFKIEGLARLKDVKSADGKWSLMHFLVDMVKDDPLGNLDFTQEDGLKEMREVRNYDYLDLIARILDLEKFWKIQNQEWGPQSNNLGADDTSDELEWDANFKTLMQPILEEGRVLIEGLKQSFDDFGEAWCEAAKYFGEDIEDYAAFTYKEGVEVVQMGLTSSHQLLSGPGSGRRKGSTHIHSASGKIEALGNRKLPIHLFISLDLFFKAFEEGVKTNRKKMEEEQKKSQKGPGKYAEKRGYYHANNASSAAYAQYQAAYGGGGIATSTAHTYASTSSTTTATTPKSPTQHDAEEAALSSAESAARSDLPTPTADPDQDHPSLRVTGASPTLAASPDDDRHDADDNMSISDYAAAYQDEDDDGAEEEEEGEGVQGGLSDVSKREEAKAMFHRFSMMQIGSRVVVDDEDEEDDDILIEEEHDY